MQPITVIGVTGAVVVAVQLAVLYIPGFNAWFQGLKSEAKQVVFLALDVAAAGIWAGILVANCFGIPGIACPVYDPASTVQVIVTLAGAFLVSVGAVAGGQQGLFNLLPQPKAVIDAKAARPA